MRLFSVLAVIMLFSTNVLSQFVDEATPVNVKPDNALIQGEWKLDFSDEFNGKDVDNTKWNIDNSTRSRAARPKIGISDWRWKPENVSVADGNLILKVLKTGTSSMTNGSINSYTKYLTQYGYFEARIKVGDASRGTHTAFWLQGPNMGNVDGTANDGAEIDIFETAWTGEYTKSVVHIDGYGVYHKANTKQYNTPGIHSGFHTWGFHWTEHFMDIYYDGIRKVRYTDPKWVVKSPEFLWLSNGASFGVEGDQYFKDFPIGYLTETQVDFIRVWKDVSTTESDSLLDQSKWSLIKADSEDNHGSNLAIYAFDGNPFTFWHTEWKENQPPHPHEIQIHLGDTAKILGFNYLPRQDNNPNGNIGNYQFYASNDSLNWGDPIKTGTFSADGKVKSIALDMPINCQYVKLVALSEVNGLVFSNVAELNLVGNYVKDMANSIDEIRGDMNESVFTSFPNPFRNKITVSYDETYLFSGFRMFSLDGKLIRAGAVSEPDFTIETNGLVPGLYIICLSSETRTAVKMIMKK